MFNLRNEIKFWTEIMGDHGSLLLDSLPSDQVEDIENIRLHTIWLRDSASHAATIAADLDSTEAILWNYLSL